MEGIMGLRHHPVALILTRQAVPTLDRRGTRPPKGCARGAYILADAPNPEVLLLGTGSEGLSARGARAARGGRHPDTGGEHAVVGDVRVPLQPSPRLPRGCSPGGGHGAGFGGAGSTSAGSG